MKIEKISDNQIRCTLTRADLEERHIRLSEFAYGTEKAKQLFRDMMLQAYRECGWSNEANIPLMIEAIPDRENSLVLIITKVDDPEELDTRFAKFTPTDVMPDGGEDLQVEGADDILDVFRKFFDQKKGAAKNKKAPKAAPNPAKSGTEKAGGEMSVTRAYRFDSLDGVIRAAAALRGFYRGSNTLYRRKTDGVYILVARQSSHTPEDFNRICNILSEYGNGENWTAASEAHLVEHDTTVIANSALQQLAKLTEKEKKAGKTGDAHKKRCT